MAVAVRRMHIPHRPRAVASERATQLETIAVLLRPVAFKSAVVGAVLLSMLVLTAVSVLLCTARTLWVYSKIIPGIARAVALSAGQLLRDPTAGLATPFARIRQSPDAGLYIVGALGVVCLGWLVGQF
jgi:hypothetical protein